MDSTVHSSLSLVSPLLASAGFRHGFSTRALEHVPGSWERFAAQFAEAAGLDVAGVHQAKQVHGAAVVLAKGTLEQAWHNEADALVARPGDGPRAVGVRVADCVPLLVGDSSSGAVAAIHAGWRGVVHGVVRAALSTLAPSAPSPLVCAIGPCIGPCCFEVGHDVAGEIARASTNAVIVRTSGEKSWVDLRVAVRAQLEALGVDRHNVDDVPGCTFCESDRFFSYRREKGTNGRHLAAIRTRA
jgi:YfiH family protein